MRRFFTFALVGATIGCGTLRDIGPESPEKLHPPGWADAASPAFHGAYLKGLSYDYTPCRSCHGGELGGGIVGVACSKCHEGGPEGCTTCHGQPPKTGAHTVHVPRFPCATCHNVPPRYDAPGHFNPPEGQRVVLTGLAAQGGLAPTYDGEKCSNVYCHGAASPKWKGGPAEAACGTCHGTPPTNHYQATCSVCHTQVVDSSMRIIDDSKHVNGRKDAVDLGPGCASCHGLPPPTGAHLAHINAGRVGKAVPCETCHVVPTRFDSPGHFDATLRATVILSGLATHGGVTPTYDADAKRCSNAYCHGATLRGGALTTPQWTAGRAATACGNCHGVPYPNHHGPVCADCHGAVVDQAYNIIRPDLHMNGRVDFGSAP